MWRRACCCCVRVPRPLGGLVACRRPRCTQARCADWCPPAAGSPRPLCPARRRRPCRIGPQRRVSHSPARRASHRGRPTGRSTSVNQYVNAEMRCPLLRILSSRIRGFKDDRLAHHRISHGWSNRCEYDSYPILCAGNAGVFKPWGVSDSVATSACTGSRQYEGRRRLHGPGPRAAVMLQRRR